MQLLEIQLHNTLSPGLDAQDLESPILCWGQHSNIDNNSHWQHGQSQPTYTQSG